MVSVFRQSQRDCPGLVKSPRKNAGITLTAGARVQSQPFAYYRLALGVGQYLSCGCHRSALRCIHGCADAHVVKGFQKRGVARIVFPQPLHAVFDPNWCLRIGENFSNGTANRFRALFRSKLFGFRRRAAFSGLSATRLRSLNRIFDFPGRVTLKVKLAFLLMQIGMSIPRRLPSLTRRQVCGAVVPLWGAAQCRIPRLKIVVDCVDVPINCCDGSHFFYPPLSRRGARYGSTPQSQSSTCVCVCQPDKHGWNYANSALNLQCTDSPMFIPCEAINAHLTAAVNGALAVGVTPETTKPLKWWQKIYIVPLGLSLVGLALVVASWVVLRGWRR